jgi:hypothetical protein
LLSISCNWSHHIFVPSFSHILFLHPPHSHTSHTCSQWRFQHRDPIYLQVGLNDSALIFLPSSLLPRLCSPKCIENADECTPTCRIRQPIQCLWKVSCDSAYISSPWKIRLSMA